MRAFIILLLFLSLSACTSFRIGEPYDQRLDDEISTFHKSSVAFLKEMAQNTSSAEGSYDSEAAKKYYASAKVAVSSIVLRARLLSNRDCPGLEIARLVDIWAALEPTVLAELKERGIIFDPEEETLDHGGNCVLVGAFAMKVTAENLERLHDENDNLGPTVAELYIEAFDNVAYGILTMLEAKKY